MTATVAAREAELLHRVQQRKSDLRARPLIEDGWTHDPAGDSGPGPLHAPRRALEIVTQECENGQDVAAAYRDKAERAEEARD